jgi:ABC-type polysaccharide/polyol phosphate export permease
MVRSPLLGQRRRGRKLFCVAVLTAVGWWLTYLLFSYFRKRIAYWS